MSKCFSSHNGKISYSDSGAGNVIVLIHGYLETREIWNDFASELSLRYRVIAVDLPGHGGSDLMNEPQTMESMADSVFELIKGLGLSKVFLAGHSLGGYITLAFVERHPELLTGYALFHSHPFADTRVAIENRNRQIILAKEGKSDQFYPDSIRRMYADSNLYRNKDALNESLEIASSIGGDGIIAVLKAMIDRPSRQHLMERGDIPCLWILGARDNYISYREAVAKLQLPGSSKVVILENSGHMGFIEEKDLSVKILTEFIEALK